LLAIIDGVSRLTHFFILISQHFSNAAPPTALLGDCNSVSHVNCPTHEQPNQRTRIITHVVVNGAPLLFGQFEPDGLAAPTASGSRPCFKSFVRCRRDAERFRYL
jgi:hypothetical protein